MKRATVHLKMVNGVWLAFGKGPRWQRNLLLVPAINLCNRLNRDLSNGVKEKNA